MILRKIYKIGEKVSNFSATLSLLVFYGWAGNSVTISTAFVNVMRGWNFYSSATLKLVRLVFFLTESTLKSSFRFFILQNAILIIRWLHLKKLSKMTFSGGFSHIRISFLFKYFYYAPITFSYDSNCF